MSELLEPYLFNKTLLQRHPSFYMYNSAYYVY
jgi:hypothetical protein